MSKFIDETLKENGVWSMKRVIVAVFVPFDLLLATYIVLSDRFLGDKVVNPYAIQIFDSILLFITAALGLTAVASYLIEKVKSKTETYQEKTTSETTIINPSKEETIG